MSSPAPSPLAASAMDATLVAGPQESAVPQVLSPGVVVGRYAVVEQIGSGAMGVVYLARDPDLGREVALKMLSGSGTDGEGPTARTRLLREAQAMARIAHQNVVAVHDVGISGHDVFMAMEYVRGATLARWLETERPWRDILDMFIETGRGLAAAHQAKLVHRDFKPDNVLVGTDGRPRVTDFGLVYANEAERRPVALGDLVAQAQTIDALVTSLTIPGVVMGTPRYMAPEQFTGESVDARSDQFSFCVALWEALYGQRPFLGDTLAELFVAVTAGRISLPRGRRDIPAWVQESLRRGLSLQPSERWPNMNALLAALERRSDFDASRAPRNAAALRVEAFLGLLLVPAFWALDWYVIPDHVMLSLAMRLACAAYAVILLWLAWRRPRTIERHVNPLSVSFSLLVAWSIAMMCFLHTGYESPYYAGINLLVLSVGLLYSWSAKTAVLFNLGVYLFYLAPLLLGLLQIHDATTAVSNQVFLMSTMLVTVVSQGYRRRLERNEFHARATQERLEAQLMTDVVTGFYNRSHFLRLGDEEGERSRRHGYPLSVILLSVQRLDSAGAPVGANEDDVVVVVAARLAAAVRRSDVTASFSSTRFAVLLPETGKDVAQALAEKLCAKIGGPPVPTSAGPRRVDVRGCAVELDVQGEGFLEAVARAERALASGQLKG